MLNRAGLLRAGAENLVPYAIDVYARRNRRWTRAHWHQTAKFAKTFGVEVDGARSVPIHFLGLWDSVKAAGILRRSMTWPDTLSLPNVTHVRHAVSIDEKRRPYREYLVEPDPERPPMDLREVWFAGVHSDIGGSFDDDHRLADIALRWMVEEAVSAGLTLDSDGLPRVTAEYALGKVHRMSWRWALLTYRKRPIRSGSTIHASVRTRMESDPSYELRTSAAKVQWDDPNWTEGRM